jgi:hypothetical protein
MDYSDIIDLPYDGVKKHPHAPLTKRAAIMQAFMPLEGYAKLIEETRRKIELEYLNK